MRAPTVIALLLGVAFLVAEPRPGDLAVHAFRAEHFGREGFAIWNGQWYGGHHSVGYSALAAPLGWLFGVRALLVASAVVCAVLFERLVRAEFGGTAALAGACWFSIGTATLLGTGRMPFALGAALGLGALLALQRHRHAVATGLALVCPLASPVAGVFLAMAGLACAVAALERRRRVGGALAAVAALAPSVLLAVAFPEGGYAPFPFSAYVAIPLFCVAFLALVPRERRALRAGAVLYAALGTGAALLNTAIGGTAPRLGMLFGGPLLLCAVLAAPRRLPPALAVAGVAVLAFWQWTSAAQDLHKAFTDPAARPGYFKPLRDFLASLPDQRRIEIPFTDSRWEAAEIAGLTPLARGWQRQLDTARNPVFYGRGLNEITYAAWLSENAVRYVALPSAKPDASSYRERGLIERGLPYLRPRWRSKHWRVYEVTLPAPFVIPEGEANITLEQLGSDRLLLRVRRPGAALVRVRWSPYWLAHGACVEARGGWTRVIARRSGRFEVVIRFSPERVVQRGRRCDP